jgi:hypothetical protein
MFGFAVVSLVDSALKPGEKVPKVESPADYILRFVHRFGARRVYRATPVDAGTAMQVFSRTRIQAGRNGDERPSRALIYVLDHPLDDGTLTSPLASILEDLLAVHWTRENYLATDFEQSHPVYGVQSVPPKTAADPMELPDSPENRLGIFTEKQQVDATRHEAEIMKQCILAAYGLQQNVNMRRGQSGRSSLVTRFGMNPMADDAPYARCFNPGPYHQIVDPPRASYNPHMVEVIRTIHSHVASVLGIPGQFLATEQVQHAANAELNLHMFNDVVRAYQKILEHFLQDLYDTTYHESHENFRAAVQNEIRQAEREQERERIGRPGVNKFIEATGEPTQSKLPPRKEVTRSDQIHLSKVLGRNFADQNGSGKSQHIGKPPVVLTDEKLAAVLERDIRFRICFGRTPLTDRESLRVAYEEANIISYQEFARCLAENIGLPASRVLTEAEHDEQIKKKAKLASELVEKFEQQPDTLGMTPAPAEPAQPPGGGKGAKKPAAKKPAAKKPAAKSKAGSSSGSKEKPASKARTREATASTHAQNKKAASMGTASKGNLTQKSKAAK